MKLDYSPFWKLDILNIQLFSWKGGEGEKEKRKKKKLKKQQKLNQAFLNDILQLC